MPCPWCGCLLWADSRSLLPWPDGLRRLALWAMLWAVPAGLVAGFVLLSWGVWRFGCWGLVFAGLILMLLGRRLPALARWFGKMIVWARCG